MKTFQEVFFKRRRNCPKHPWITKGILKSIKHRNRLYKRSLQNPSDNNISKYKQYRNKLTSIIRFSKKMHYIKQFELHKNNSSSTWKLINDILMKGKSFSYPSTLMLDGVSFTDSHDIANNFNMHFTNLGPSQAE